MNLAARYYDAALGRFLSVDPKERRTSATRPQEWNRYTYALNNPLKYVDPDGRDAEIAAGSDVRAVKAYLTELARRPSGRAQLTAVANDPNFKLRMTTGARYFAIIARQVGATAYACYRNVRATGADRKRAPAGARSTWAVRSDWRNDDVRPERDLSSTPGQDGDDNGCS